MMWCQRILHLADSALRFRSTIKTLETNQMKRQCFAAALALGGGACAYGQSSVTLYGVIDTNIEVVNHASATGGTVVRENSGGLSNSRFGFRGSEDLGGGNAAFFDLEAGYNSNDGSNATTGILFNRTAAVGLSSPYGALSAGLQYTAMYDTLIEYDPMSYAPQYTWFPTTGSSDDFSFKARLNNSVKYVGHFGGLTTTAIYSFGGVAGSFQSSAAYGGALNYATGGFAAALAYDYRNGAANTAGMWSKTRLWSASARQQIAALTVLGGYEHYLNQPIQGASQSSAMWFGGFRYLIVPSVKLTTALYYQTNRAAGVSNSWMGVFSGDYILSKRTDVYATVAYAASTHYANGQTTPVGVTDASAFASNQTGVTIGIRHRF
jgi:predicted porin